MEEKMYYLVIAHIYLGAMLVIDDSFTGAACMWLVNIFIACFFYYREERNKRLAHRDQIENIMKSKKSRGKHGQRK